MRSMILSQWRERRMGVVGLPNFNDSTKKTVMDLLEAG